MKSAKGNILTYIFGISASVLSICFIIPLLSGYAAPLPVAAAGVACIFLAREADELPDLFDGAVKWFIRRYHVMRKPTDRNTKACGSRMPAMEQLQTAKGGNIS